MLRVTASILRSSRSRGAASCRAGTAAALLHLDLASRTDLAAMARALIPERGGNETDFHEIESDARRLCSRLNVTSAGDDPWQSAQMSQRSRAEGVPMHEFRATTQNLGPAIVELDAPMRAGRLRHDGAQCSHGLSAMSSARPTSVATCIQRSSSRNRRLMRPSPL
jgi:hypothetical protein